MSARRRCDRAIAFLDAPQAHGLRAEGRPRAPLFARRGSRAPTCRRGRARGSNAAKRRRIIAAMYAGRATTSPLHVAAHPSAESTRTRAGLQATGQAASRGARRPHSRAACAAYRRTAHPAKHACPLRPTRTRIRTRTHSCTCTDILPRAARALCCSPPSRSTRPCVVSATVGAPDAHPAGTFGHVACSAHPATRHHCAARTGALDAEQPTSEGWSASTEHPPVVAPGRRSAVHPQNTLREPQPPPACTHSESTSRRPHQPTTAPAHPPQSQQPERPQRGQRLTLHRTRVQSRRPCAHTCGLPWRRRRVRKCRAVPLPQALVALLSCAVPHTDSRSQAAREAVSAPPIEAPVRSS